MTTALWTVGETDQLQTLPLPSLLKKRLVGTTVTFETTGDLHSVQKNLQGLLTGPDKKDGLIGDADQRYFWFAYYNGGGEGMVNFSKAVVGHIQPLQGGVLRFQIREALPLSFAFVVGVAILFCSGMMAPFLISVVRDVNSSAFAKGAFGVGVFAFIWIALVVYQLWEDSFQSPFPLIARTLGFSDQSA